MDNIYIALLLRPTPFFRLVVMPERSTTLATSQKQQQAASRDIIGRQGRAGRQYAIESRSTLIMRDFSRLYPYDRQLIIRFRYDTEQKEQTVRPRKTDSHKIHQIHQARQQEPAADPAANKM